MGDLSKGRVVVGMSGGVDSSVAAFLLKEEGYDVLGVTMNIWQGEDETGGCCGIGAARDARRVCDTIGAAHYVLNFKEVFRRRVIDKFEDEYRRGHTPNPCIDCNRYVKWEALLNRAAELGAEYIATGHYAKITKNEESGRYAVSRAYDSHKDQTYALYNLTQEQLAHTLFPLGGYEKTQVRKIARDIGLLVADKPDSQEICFIPDDDYGGYLSKCYGETFGAGAFVDGMGKELGRHKGYYRYTIGQRRGLKTGFGKRAYVTAIDPKTCAVTLGEDRELLTDMVYARDISYMAIEKIHAPIRAAAKIRYNHIAADATICLENGMLKCVFDTPQRALAPGQALVCYGGSLTLCGGTITRISD